LSSRTVLFDLDGTLIDSRTSVDRQWRAWAIRHGLDSPEVLAFVYGHRTAETVMHFLPHADAKEETKDIDSRQEADTAGVEAMPGALEVLDQLREGAWAIVTSASRRLALSRLRAAQLSHPHVLVTADDVKRGKPAPDGYLLAARKLGASPRSCIVVEDTPSGVEAAKSAGMLAIALTTTHKASELSEADQIIDTLDTLLALLTAPT
jgi:HAD superfamily hydrolase (TIGR01509 family)